MRFPPDMAAAWGLRVSVSDNDEWCQNRNWRFDAVGLCKWLLLVFLVGSRGWSVSISPTATGG